MSIFLSFQSVFLRLCLLWRAIQTHLLFCSCWRWGGGGGVLFHYPADPDLPPSQFGLLLKICFSSSCLFLCSSLAAAAEISSDRRDLLCRRRKRADIECSSVGVRRWGVGLWCSHEVVLGKALGIGSSDHPVSSHTLWEKCFFQVLFRLSLKLKLLLWQMNVPLRWVQFWGQIWGLADPKFNVLLPFSLFCLI